MSVSAAVASLMNSEKRVVELDGARSGPLDRGTCTDLLRVRHITTVSVLTKRTLPKSFRKSTWRGPKAT